MKFRRFDQSGTTQRYFIDGGFVQIAGNVVSVMADRAIASSQLKADEARERLSTATAEAASGEQIDEREKRVAQARAMLRVAERSAS